MSLFKSLALCALALSAPLAIAGQEEVLGATREEETKGPKKERERKKIKRKTKKDGDDEEKTEERARRRSRSRSLFLIPFDRNI